MTDILGIIIAGMGIALILNILFIRYAIPQIIGYILTGTILVSLFGLHDAADSTTLHEIAEFGIIFLMFMIGLEFSYERINSMKKEVVLFGGLQVIFSALLFFLLTHLLFGIGTKSALIISFAFALSSTAIVLKSFNESREIRTPHGNNVVGILIFQDIAVIPILLMVAMLADRSQSLGAMLTTTFVQAVIVLFILFWPGKKLIAYLLSTAAKTRRDEVFVGMVLFLVIATSYLVHAFGFSYTLGAFLAGMIIAETKYKYQVEADLQHFRDLLLGVFFVTVGMQVNLGFLGEHLFEILALLAGILLLKTMVIYAVIRPFTQKDPALKTAISLCQVGEFSFVIFELSSSRGLLDPHLHQLLVLTVIFSMILTPFILKHLPLLTRWFSPKPAQEKPMEQKFCQLCNHIVVCGYGTFGREVVAQLKHHDVVYAAVDFNQDSVDQGIAQGDRVMFGNVAQKTILDKLQVQDAVSVIVAVSDPHRVRVICESILERSPRTHVVVKITNDEEARKLADLPIHRIVDEKKEIAKLLALAAISSDFGKISRN